MKIYMPFLAISFFGSFLPIFSSEPIFSSDLITGLNQDTITATRYKHRVLIEEIRQEQNKQDRKIISESTKIVKTSGLDPISKISQLKALKSEAFFKTTRQTIDKKIEKIREIAKLSTLPDLALPQNTDFSGRSMRETPSRPTPSPEAVSALMTNPSPTKSAFFNKDLESKI